MVLCDEALQGLDPARRAAALGALARVGRAAPGRPALVQVTHHADEVLPDTTHALHLVRGRVAFCGAADAARVAELMREDERHPWHHERPAARAPPRAPLPPRVPSYVAAARGGGAR